MRLKKAVLISGGTKGLRLTVSGFRKVNDEFMSPYEDDRKDKLPAPMSVRNQFQKLRYFFLTMMGLWDDDHTQFLTEDFSHIMDLDEYMAEHSDKDREGVSHEMMLADTVLQKTFITGFENDKDEIKIMGTYEHIEGKPFVPALPFLNEGDDYAFFHEALDAIHKITAQLLMYAKSETLELKEMRALLLEQQAGKEEEIERVKEQTQEENYAELMARLESQAVIFPLKGSELEKALARENGIDKTEIVSDKTITDSKAEEAEEVKEETAENVQDGVDQHIEETDTVHTQAVGDPDFFQ